MLAKVKRLDLDHTQITDAGCATLVAALESGALPAIEILYLDDTLAGAAAKAAVHEARANLRDGALASEHEKSGSEEDEESEEEDGCG